jgi:hypothetical protein
MITEVDSITTGAEVDRVHSLDLDIYLTAIHTVGITTGSDPKQIGAYLRAVSKRESRGAADSGRNCLPNDNRHITERKTKLQYLIDTGSDLCVFPRSRVSGPRTKTRYELFAANGTIIHTYGSISLTLDLGLRIKTNYWRRFFELL